MTHDDVVREIEALIDRFARALDDAAFLAALEELEDRAQTARIARKEETGL